MVLDLVSEIRSLIGAPPAGFEFLEYVFLGFLLVFLVCTAFNILASIFRWIGGGS